MFAMVQTGLEPGCVGGTCGAPRVPVPAPPFCGGIFSMSTLSRI
jgi:hypothetical protein